MNTKSKSKAVKSNNKPKRKMTSSDVKEAIEIVENLPEEQKMIVAERITSTYSGPIPHYSDFKHYEEVLPGAADRILKMSENQAEHRQTLEKAAILSGIDDSKR